MPKEKSWVSSFTPPSNVEDTPDPEPKVETKPSEPEKTDKEKEATSCLEEAATILKEYGGLEGNVPYDSNYWGLMNKYRGLVNK